MARAGAFLAKPPYFYSDRWFRTTGVWGFVLGVSRGMRLTMQDVDDCVSDISVPLSPCKNDSATSFYFLMISENRSSSPYLIGARVRPQLRLDTAE